MPIPTLPVSLTLNNSVPALSALFCTINALSVSLLLESMFTYTLPALAKYNALFESPF